MAWPLRPQCRVTTTGGFEQSPAHSVWLGHRPEAPEQKATQLYLQHARDMRPFRSAGRKSVVGHEWQSTKIGDRPATSPVSFFLPVATTKADGRHRNMRVPCWSGWRAIDSIRHSSERAFSDAQGPSQSTGELCHRAERIASGIDRSQGQSRNGFPQHFRTSSRRQS